MKKKNQLATLLNIFVGLNIFQQQIRGYFTFNKHKQINKSSSSMHLSFSATFYSVCWINIGLKAGLPWFENLSELHREASFFHTPGLIGWAISPSLPRLNLPIFLSCSLSFHLSPCLSFSARPHVLILIPLIFLALVFITYSCISP